MIESRCRWTGVLCLAIAAGAAHADAMSDSQCEQIRNWVAGVPAGPQQAEQLLQPGYFSKNFGRPYEQLTIADLRQLDVVTTYNCRQLGNMTPQQLKTANDLLSERAQQRWMAMPGHGSNPPTADAASPKKSWQDKLAAKVGLKSDSSPAAAPGAAPAPKAAATPVTPAPAPATAPATATAVAVAGPAPAPAASDAKRSWKDKLKDQASQLVK